MSNSYSKRLLVARMGSCREPAPMEEGFSGCNAFAPANQIYRNFPC